MNLRQLRRKYNLTLGELADKLGVTPPAVHKMERLGIDKISLIDKYVAITGEPFDAVLSASRTTQSESSSHLASCQE